MPRFYGVRTTPIERLLIVIAALASGPATLAAFAPPLDGEVITVTTGEDDVDIDPGSAVLANLPGPDGLVSFSEALIVSNNMAGRQTIAFAVPQGTWLMQGLFPGRMVLRTDLGFYWQATDPVVIDGRTQTAFTGDTYALGAEVYPFGDSIIFLAPDCEIYGFDSAQIEFNGDNSTVRACTGQTNVVLYGCDGGTVGGTNAGDGNTLNVVTIDRADNIVVMGNDLRRVRVLGGAGSFGAGQALNNRIGGPTPPEGNIIRGLGFWDSSGVPSGAAVQLIDTFGTVVQNNQIGLTPDGLSQATTNCSTGIELGYENNDVLINGNRIAGILAHFIFPSNPALRTGYGIVAGGAGNGLTISDNIIGLNVAGQPLGSISGVDVGGVNFSTLSGVVIQGNTIAGHGLDGVLVRSGIGDATLSQNLIFDNAGLGIDLQASDNSVGASSNDALDADTGGNGVQNYPEILTAANVGGDVVLSAMLHSEPLKSYRLEFYYDTGCNSALRGQARTYIGSEATVTTDALGNWTGIVTVTGASVPAGSYLAAIATDIATGATSEFCPCFDFSGTASVADWSSL